MYQIEKSIPLPTPRKFTTGASKYPWRQLQVGDSFVADKKMINIARQAYEASKRIGGGVRFSCRKIDNDNTRVWRVA